MARQLLNYLDSFLEFTEPLPTPHNYRVWSGITLISSALARRVWLRANSRLPLCYPNLMTLLAGDPGIGKDVAINKVGDIIYTAIQKAAPSIVARLGGESISPKGLIDKLADAASKQSFTFKEGGEKHTADFHSLTFCIGELGTAMPEYDPRLVPILNDMYNNKKSFEDTIRGVEVKVPNPHITLLLGNQPNTLAEVFPEKAFRMGLTSRIIFVFANSPVIQDLFVAREEEIKWNPQLEEDLAHDYIELTKMAGPFTATPQTKELINEFNRERPAPVPTQRFKDYNTRRPLHAQKVAMCVAAAESSSMVLEPHHWLKALEILFAAEQRMPEIFADVVTSRGFSETYAEIVRMGDEGKPIPHHTLVRRLSRTHAAYEVKQIIDLAITDGLLVPMLDEAHTPIKPPKFTVRNF